MAYITPDATHPRIFNSGSSMIPDQSVVFDVATPVGSWNQPGGEQLGTLVPYTITGVTSEQLNGASLTGNFQLTSTRTGRSPFFLAKAGTFPTQATMVLRLTDNPDVTSSVTIFADAPPPPPAFTATVTLPSNNVVRNSSTTFTPLSVSGGVTPYSYTISPSLPEGLALNNVTGTISGTPTTTSATTTYTITVTDSDTQTRSGNFTLAVLATDNDVVRATLSDLTATTLYIKNLLDNMPNYTTQLNNLVTALQTIATNSTTDATNLATIATNSTTDATNLATVATRQTTIAEKQTAMETYQKKMKELGEGDGIHFLGPYEKFGLVSIYRMMIEQAKILESSGVAATPEQVTQALVEVRRLSDLIRDNIPREF
jgi:hypothetical protein